MQFLKYNRGAASAALAVLVILSVLLGVNRSVSSLAGKVEDAYIDTQVQSDLTKYVGYARQFAAAAEALYGKDAALTSAIEELNGALTTPIGMGDRLDAVSTLAAAVYYKLNLDEKADETVKKSAIAYFYEMQSTEMRLANNEDYAGRANKYNDAIRGLPVSLLSPGRKPAATFQ